MDTMTYAGIGSRETPEYILVLMQKLAVELRLDGYKLRTGHAIGADQAFERGAMSDATVFLPWKGFEDEIWCFGDVVDHPTQQAHDIAAQYHPRWNGLKRGARSLHARNVHILLGKSCNNPVDFIICWTPNGAITGGTGQALRMAQDYDIPVRNLAFDDVFDDAFEWAWGDGS